MAEFLQEVLLIAFRVSHPTTWQIPVNISIILSITGKFLTLVQIMRNKYDIFGYRSSCIFHVLHVHTAIDVEDVSGDVAGILAGQEAHGSGNVFRPAQTL